MLDGPQESEIHHEGTKQRNNDAPREALLLACFVLFVSLW
jgi:hypothetical protein